MLIEPIGIYEVGIDARPSGNVTVPNKVKTLATRVFQNDENVTSIKLPPYLNEIQEYAFQNCKNLLKIDFPQSLQIVNQYAFDGCTNLITIDVPNNIAILRPKAFGGNNIGGLILEEDFSPKLWDYAYADNQSIGSVILKCYLVSSGCFQGSDIESVIIENTTKVLKDRAFENCKKLSNFTLNSGLIEIGDYCFHNCGLQEISIPNSIKKIGEYCFAQDENSGVNGLQSVTLEEGLTSIGKRAFSKSALKEVLIPKSIQVINVYAFDDCPSLAIINFEDGLEQIGTVDGYCFSNCGVLSLNIPASVQKISKYAFYNCKKLEQITLNGNINKDALGKSIFENCTSLYQINLMDVVESLGESMFRGCTALKTIDLPNGFKNLGERCFENSGLETLDIPETIESIGSYCFNNCKLSSISLPKTLETIEPYTFSGCDQLGSIDFNYIEETLESGQGVHKIKDFAFSDSIITSLNIPYTIQEIGLKAFNNSKITTLRIDKIKNSIAGAPWGASSATVIWRESTLTFSSNETFFELWVSQNDEIQKKKINTVDNNKYVFEPFDNGITLNCTAYAPNKAPISKQLKYSRLQREVEEEFNFSELNSPCKITFTFTDAETGKAIEDVQLEAETIFEDFNYTYRDYEFYLNEGTVLSYTISRPGYSGTQQSSILINESKTYDIQLSKNGYVYYEIKPPYNEFPQFTKHLIDGENYDICDVTNTMITNYIACKNTPIDGSSGVKRFNSYIKFRTPNDTTSVNTISVTINPGYIQQGIDGNANTHPRIWIGLGETLYYSPNDHTNKRPPDVRPERGSGYISLAPYNTSIDAVFPNGGGGQRYYLISSAENGNEIQCNGYFWDTIKNIVLTKKLTNLKPNTDYYLMFSVETSQRATSSQLIRGRVAFEKISFSSCPIDDGAAELLPGVISGEKTCLYDGMGKLEPYINSSYFDTSTNLIFDKVFDYSNQGVDFRNNISNCCGNFVYKTFALSDATGGNTDAAIIKLNKPFHTDDYTKLKITCINYHDYTKGEMQIASYCRLCDEGDIQPLEANTSYYWGNTDKPWREMFSGQLAGLSYCISTTTLDLTEMTGDKSLYIGVYHGTSPTNYTAVCGIVELELQ